MALYGITVLLPQFIEVLLGYPAVTAGMALAGGDFARIVIMPIAGQVASRADPRKAMVIGFAAAAAYVLFRADAAWQPAIRADA